MEYRTLELLAFLVITKTCGDVCKYYWLNLWTTRDANLVLIWGSHLIGLR